MFNLFKSAPRGWQDLNPGELNQMLKEKQPLLVVDVREPWEYAQGHVPGAKLVPLGEIMNGGGTFPADKPIVLICAHGNRSRTAASFLQRRGLTPLYNVVGGTAAWTRAGLPVTGGKK